METAEELRKELEKARRIIEESRASEARALQQAKESKAAEARALQQVKDTEARSMQRVKEAEARALTEQRQRENAEKVVASTDFRTFLSLCHNNLYANLTIQEDPDLSATGMFTNVDSKFYPLCLKPWAEFPSLHDECQTRLETLFKDKRVFPSVAGLHTMNEMLAIDEPLADENDGRLLQFINAESSARRVMFQYLKESKADPFLANNDTDQNEDNNGSEDEGSTAFPIRVYFSNAPHGILLDIPESSDESQHSDTKPAYKPAMLEAQQKDAEARGRSEGNGPPPAKRKSSPVRKFHPDQWFMRVNGDGSIIPVFVVEYKAAHKLRGSTLKQALSDTTCEPQGLFATAIREQIRNKIIQSDKDRVDAEKATARVIAQAFHYMVEFGLCYSYVASVEALILLYFDKADVRTLYYHLALPQEDVKSDAAEDVRRSAVALVSTMALLALDAPVLSQRWKKHAVDVLERWPAPYDELLHSDESSEEEGAKKMKNTPQLAPNQSQQRRRKDDDDDREDREFPPPRSLQVYAGLTEKQYATRSKGTTNTTSTTSTTNNTNNTTRRQHKVLPYCSQACILGLRNGGSLDRDCPNVQLHPSSEDGCHKLTAVQFCNQLREQLACDLDENCDALDKFGKFGAIGMLFRLTLKGCGYCVTAKGVQLCLGVFALVDVYRTSVGAHISHMMAMSYAGERVGTKAAGPMPDNINSLVYDAWVRLRQLGVEHGDERGPNMLWNAPLQRLMCIDFEWSKIIEWKERKRKRKYGIETHSTPESPNTGWKRTVSPQSLSSETRESVLI